MKHFQTIIIGAGAAGLMCAARVGQQEHSVLLLDHAEKVGKKILISGGGRCNFTNLFTGPENFISDNPHFMKSALKRYTPYDFIEFVDRHQINWHEKTLGQLFCDGSARQIVRALEDECARGHVTVKLDHQIKLVTEIENGYQIKFGDEEYTSQNLVIATGGPSIPKMGATGFAFGLAKQFKLKLVEPAPALVPLTLGSGDAMFKYLAGIAIPVRVSTGDASFDEAALFTHKGLSGPAILQVSSYWHHGQKIRLNLLPNYSTTWLHEAKSAHPNIQLKTELRKHFPQRLADQLDLILNVSKPLAEIKTRDLQDIADMLASWNLVPTGTEGYAKAEVTRGGIDTDELSSRTMEVKKKPGLYFIGECVDVTGWLGGYNFQWAWASAVAASQNLNNK